MPEAEGVRFLTRASGVFVAVPGQTFGKAALVVHGWKSNPGSKSYACLQDRLVAAGYSTLVLTLRGHEEGQEGIEGVSRKDHMRDIEAAYDWLVRHESVDPAQVIGVGVSYGAYLLSAFCYIQKEWGVRFQALALRSPALYPDAGWSMSTAEVVKQSNLREWRSMPHSSRETAAYLGIATLKGPLLVVWGDQDEDIPRQVFEGYCDLAGSSKVNRLILSGAGHVFEGDQRDRFLEQVSCWASRLNIGLSLV